MWATSGTLTVVPLLMWLAVCGNVAKRQCGNHCVWFVACGLSKGLRWLRISKNRSRTRIAVGKLAETPLQIRDFAIKFSLRFKFPGRECICFLSFLLSECLSHPWGYRKDNRRTSPWCSLQADGLRSRWANRTAAVHRYQNSCGA